MKKNKKAKSEKTPDKTNDSGNYEVIEEWMPFGGFKKYPGYREWK